MLHVVKMLKKHTLEIPTDINDVFETPQDHAVLKAVHQLRLWDGEETPISNVRPNKRLGN